MKKTILVIVAHPDDEVLACGGTIAKHTSNGDNVTVAILGEGKSARQSAENADSIRDEILALRREAERANAILGVREVVFHNFPDNAIDSIPLLNVIQYIEGLKRKYSPDIVYTHHHSDINIDHQLIFKAVITAFRPIKNDYVPYIYSCEVPSATEWQAPIAGLGFQPNVFVDISDTLDIKKQALAMYKSELRSYPHPRSVEAIEITAKRWGLVVGFEAAEPFFLVRSVLKRVGDFDFTIRHANIDDEADILLWRNDKTAREISERQDIISTEEHAIWFKEKLSNPKCIIYIACGDLEKKLGVIRFDEENKTHRARVSINIAPEWRQKGLGKEFLKRGIELYLTENRSIKQIDAVIKKGNHVSKYIFTKSGFKDRIESKISGFFVLRYSK